MKKINELFRELNNRDYQSEEYSHDEPIDVICGSQISDPECVRQQVDAPLLESSDVEYLANHLSQIVAQTISKQFHTQTSVTGMRNSDFENNVIWFLKNIYNGITTEDVGTGKRYYAIYKLLQDQERNIREQDAIINEIQSLRHTVEAQSKVIDEQAAIIKKQHERIIQYENDVIYKTQKDLIMELIGIADQLRYTLNDYVIEKDFDSLYKSIGDLTEWVDGSLQAVGVRKYVSVDDDFDRKRQEIVENQETEFLEKDGKVESILPGYIWAVPMIGSNEPLHEDNPKTYEFVIRPEQVARLRCVKPMIELLQQRQDKQINTYDSEGVEEKDVNLFTSEVEEVIESVEERKEDRITPDWNKW